MQPPHGCDQELAAPFPCQPRITDLLQQVDTANRNLKTIERDMVGPGPYDSTQKDLWELRVALDDLLRRAASPA